MSYKLQTKALIMSYGTREQNMDYSEHQDINEVLHSLTKGMRRVLGDDLVGIYKMRL
jgi:hypothetical protein